MSTAPQAKMLSDGQRLHLHHGPIDLIIGVDGPLRHACYRTATQRFQSILTGLVAELPQLRQPLTPQGLFNDPVAQRMVQAVRPYPGVFVTPMAAVAGSVADEILATMVAQHVPEKAYVNNGGDIAFHLSDQQRFSALSPAGTIQISASDSARGLATSGWQGRSHSLGIADAVTVLARTAAEADVAATLIANAVDLPGHSAISRAPATDLSPDSDLGRLLVTIGVGPLSAPEVAQALSKGAKFARQLIDSGEIIQAVLSLQGNIETVTTKSQIIPEGAPAYA